MLSLFIGVCAAAAVCVVAYQATVQFLTKIDIFIKNNKALVSALAPCKDSNPVITTCLKSFFNDKVLGLLQAIESNITLADIKINPENSNSQTLLELLESLVNNAKAADGIRADLYYQMLCKAKLKQLKSRIIGDTTANNIAVMCTLFQDPQHKHSALVLLSGAVATGKTLFLKTIAEAFGYAIQQFDNNDQGDIWGTAKESRVSDFFKYAVQLDKPTVLFFKDIELLLKNQQAGDGSSIDASSSWWIQQNAQICANFANGVELIQKNKNIIVIGATTDESNINASVLEKICPEVIKFNLPNLAERKQALTNAFLTIAIPNKEKIITHIAQATSGWGYAALKLYAQTVINAIQAKQNLFVGDQLTKDGELCFSEPFVKMSRDNAFKYGLGACLQPQILKLNDAIDYGVLVAMAPEIKTQLDNACSFICNAEIYLERMSGFNFSPNLLLTGPGGTGKTEFARAVARNANVPFIYINPNDFSQHESMKKLSKIFKVAKTFEKVVIFIDEADVMYHSNFPEAARNMIKTEIDGFNKLKNGSIFTVILATNYPERLDEPDKTRFTEVRFSLPNQNQRFLAIQNLIKCISKKPRVKLLYNGTSCPELGDIACQNIAEVSEGCSFREIKIAIENWYVSAVSVAISADADAVLDVTCIIKNIQSKTTLNNVRSVAFPFHSLKNYLATYSNLPPLHQSSRQQNMCSMM